ncbi:MAG: histidinol-phosphatase [Hyphomicrobiales bacterium]|nr:histidinol-phosphatase [Hyphomicrobiales bacterium]
MPDGDLDSFLTLAVALAEAAAPVTRRYFRRPVEIDDKADRSPVTVADREAEAAMRPLIAAAFPGHGIVGEELGAQDPDADFVWVLDPIDGTKSFITGKPLFGTLIGLLYRGRAIVGVIDHPALGERWIGVAGRPTTFNGAPVATRTGRTLDQAWMYATTPHMFPAGYDATAYARLCDAVRSPVYGAECYAYGLLANGTVDLVVESTMGPYDYCALVPVVQGAGGVITDWRGRPLGLEGDGRVLAAGDAALHAAAMAVLAEGAETRS